MPDLRAASMSLLVQRPDRVPSAGKLWLSILSPNGG